jgi:hypothetical protein
MKTFCIKNQTDKSILDTKHDKCRVRRNARNMSDNPIISLYVTTLWLHVIDISIIIFYSATFLSFKSHSIEQEPTSADPDSDEEADLVLSLESETGLLTNQHTKGKRGN